MSTRTETEFLEEENANLRDQLAAADRATADFRRQCSELAGELGAAVAATRAETFERLHRVGERDAARSDLNRMRTLVAEILDAFGPSGSGHTARVGQVQIAKWRQRAGLEG